MATGRSLRGAMLSRGFLGETLITGVARHAPMRRAEAWRVKDTGLTFAPRHNFDDPFFAPAAPLRESAMNRRPP